MTKPIAETVAQRLRTELEYLAPPGGRLPAIPALARRYGVSPVTMMHAARIVREENLLQFCRGRAMRRPVPVDSAPPVSSSPGSAVEKLHDALSHKLSMGQFRSGQPLPKTATLAQEHNVSSHTVCRALRRLLSEGRIHKQGRSWHAGRKQTDSVRLATRNSAVILLVMDRESSWRSLYAPRTESFSRAFSDEAANKGVELLPCIAGESPFGAILPCGHDAVFRRIDELRDRYIGALIVGDRRSISNLDSWAQSLSRIGRPVVWFDHYDQGFAGEQPPLVTRCHFSEVAAAKTALSFLHECGHRRVGFPLCLQPWMAHRAELLRSVIDREFPDMTLVGPAAEEGVNRELDEITLFGVPTPPYIPPRIAGLIDYLGRLQPELETSLEQRRLRVYDLRYVVRYTRALVETLRRGAVTAIIAPHDERARHVYNWLLYNGITIPGELSLLSFDNYADLHPYPISTIDFGFDHLGFCAFHLLYGDTAIRRDLKGAVAASPKVISRGSVCPAPERIFDVEQLWRAGT